MVHQPIAHGRLVYIARFRVGNLKGVVGAVLVRSRSKLAMQIKDVVHQAMLKFLHVALLPLASHELFPCCEEIFDGDDTVIVMVELDSLRATPPPNAFCQ